MNRFTLALVFSFIFGISTSWGDDTIYSLDFDQYTTDQTYDELDWLIDWLAPTFEKGLEEGRVEIATGEVAYNRTGACLAVSVPSGSVGTSSGGAIWPMRLPAVYSSLKLTYRVKFKGGFDFVRGGKLPGLAGGIPPTGNDFSNFTDGWSGRLMWRTEDLTPEPGTLKHSKAHLIHYLKHPTSGFDMAGQDEDKLWWDDPAGGRVTVESGKWYTITQVIQMNTPGQSDGRVASWLDGVKTYDETGFEFRNTLTKGIDVMYFNVFFGGGDSTWAATRDEVIYFDDFKIETIPDTDVLTFATVPNEFTVGKTSGVVVDYEAASDAYININLFSQSGNWITSAIQSVDGGSGSLTVPITIPVGTEPGNCELHGFMTTVPGDWQNARDWAPTENSVISATPPATVDDLEFVLLPGDLIAGESGNIYINYDAVTSGYINLSLISPTGEWISGSGEFVNAGSGSVMIPVNTPQTAAAGDYELHSFISTVQWDWQNARRWAPLTTINIKGAQQPLPTVDSIGIDIPPSQMVAGQTTNISVEYEAVTDGYLHVNLISPGGVWIAGGEVFVGAGTGTAEIPVSIGQNATPGTYDFHVFIATDLFDWQNARRWMATPASTTVVSP